MYSNLLSNAIGFFFNVSYHSFLIKDKLKAFKTLALILCEKHQPKYLMFMYFKIRFEIVVIL